MPGIRDAAWHIARVREDTGRHDTESYANGYVADGSTAERVSILAKINETITFLMRTGFSARTYDINIGNTGYVYNIPSQHIAEIYSAHISGKRLTKSTIPSWDALDPIWRQRSEAPSEYARYGNRILFNSIPPQNLVATILANSTEDVPDLTEAGSVIAVLPSRFHDGVHYGASLLLCLADSENPNSAEKIPYLERMWAVYLADLMKFVHDELGFDEVPPVTIEQFMEKRMDNDRAFAERQD